MLDIHTFALSLTQQSTGHKAFMFMKDFGLKVLGHVSIKYSASNNKIHLVNGGDLCILIYVKHLYKDLSMKAPSSFIICC